MLWRLIAVLISAAFTANALSVPPDAVKLMPKAKREECDIKVWVRADDLAPMTIVEGDVRLVNNMTTLSPATARGCQILDWSLHLRYRERGAIQIPISDMPLPKKPSYNYSWGADSRGDRGFALNKMLSNGEDVSSFLVESQVNPHEAEIQEYRRQLDEYVRAVSNADKWIVREDEIVFFDSAMNMSNSPLEVSQGERNTILQKHNHIVADIKVHLIGIQQATTSFRVAVPLVRFPEQSNKRTYWSNEDIAERILVSNPL